jgi:hypothetical protein
VSAPETYLIVEVEEARMRMYHPDEEDFRLTWLAWQHRSECSRCWMANGRMPMTGGRRRFSRRFSALQTVGLCGYGKYLAMAHLRWEARKFHDAA